MVRQYGALSEHLYKEIKKKPDIDLYRKKLYADRISYQWDKAKCDDKILQINRNLEEYKQNLGDIEGYRAELMR
jgi:tagatose-1,6-bisphosphate aldolase non-catalytic subunit AgaZ/GatZ